MAELLYEDEVFKIRGAIFEVYKEMGSGFLESVYQECLEREFGRCGVEYVARPELRVAYKGEVLSKTYCPDLVCFSRIIVELKATPAIVPEHKAQLLNYLKATNLRLGLVVNFGAPDKVQIERQIL